MTGVIICGGRITDYDCMKKYMDGADLVVSADSGARHCKNFGIVPDLMVGDFDSVEKADFAGLVSAGVKTVRFPEEKDMTDSELAIEIALQKGCNRIILLGAIGTRLDHTASNLFLLKKLLDGGVEGILADEHNEVRLIDRHIEMVREEGVYITLLPLAGNTKGVTTQGLYYPLHDATLEIGSSWGVSNRFSSDKASVTIQEGYLLVMLCRD